VAIKEQLIIEGVNKTQAALGKVQKDLGGINKATTRMSAGFSRLQGVIIGVAAAIGSIKLAGGFLDTAREVENLGVQLKFLTGSAEDGKRALDIVTEAAGNSAFQLQDMALAAPSLLAVTDNVEDLGELLEITGDIAAASGLDFQTVALQLQRTFSAGIASADLFRDRAVKSMLGFQEGVQYSAQQSKDIIINGFRDGTVSIKGASAEMATTFDGAVSMMNDKFFKFKKAVMDAAPFEFLKAAIMVVDKQAQQNFKSISEQATGIGEAIVATARRALIGGARVLDALKPIFDFITSALNGVIKFTNGLPGYIKALGIVGFFMLGTKGKLVVVAIGFVIDKVSAMFGKLMEVVANVSRKIASGASALGLSGMAENLNKFANDVEGSIGGMKVKIDNVLDGFAGDVTLEAMEFIGLPGPQKVGEYEKFILSYIEKIDQQIAVLRKKAEESTDKSEQQKLALAEAKLKKELAAQRKAFEEQIKQRASIVALEKDFLLDATRSIEDAYAKRQLIVDRALEDGLISQQRAADLEVALNKKKLQDIEEATKASLKARRIEELRNGGKTKEEAESIAEFEKKSALDKGEFAIVEGRKTFEALGKMNRDAFRAYKAFAIAEAIVSTYKGAAKAIGSYPPPFNFIAAAAVVAGGLAQVNAIKQQQYSGRAMGGPVGAGQNYIVGERGPETFRAPPGGGMIDNGSGGGQGVNINFRVEAIDSESFQDTLAENRTAIISIVNEAVNDSGRRSII
tara:strand:+ start:662 stop:2890 length:2229 start_codon:yes stop_codon:yes gene_type:complete